LTMGLIVLKRGAQRHADVQIQTAIAAEPGMVAPRTVLRLAEIAKAITTALATRSARCGQKRKRALIGIWAARTTIFVQRACIVV